ncbi:MAG: methylmalonyl Co-A mutase-associated GTPase MeaB [Deltaproteobacteria bacterium]|nr:methylmalonyl Co-A mutase-associated GTPase MeaB [Deltaproteobacteria bacterium]MBW2418146.1 methylmalonyl Co-A mutase-associated GTPase MeaB [Deltaproteobacteria bacterium]
MARAEGPAGEGAASGGVGLAERLLAGERSAVAPALNLVDDSREEQQRAALEMLDHLAREERPGGALRIGITGAPGAGKSTLLDALVRALRQREKSVGIIAVDPSSQRSGGALLGDRFRVRSGAGDDAVFLRSMAARNRLGGLADATFASVSVLAAVFDTIFVETVGIGQSESDVAQLVDSLVFVAQPGAGDTLQFMKAGILELPDVFAVNKADLGAAAERSANELRAGLGLGTAAGEAWQPPVLLLSARDGDGIDALLDALFAHRDHLEKQGDLAGRRRRALAAHVRESLDRRYGSFGLEQVGGRARLGERLGAVEGRSATSLIAELGREIEQGLGRAR